MANQTKSYRKFVASAATATLVATALVPVASAAPANTSATFTDVAPQYLEAVNHLVDSKITVGKTPTQFGTYDNITRVDAAVWIAKAVLGEGEIANAIPSDFSDVRDNAKNYVDALKEHGILNGKTDTRFGSYDEIRRGEAAIILANAYEITGDADNVTFTDVADRYKEAVAALVDNGITEGKKGNRFGQNDPITRGELAVWVHRLDTLNDEDTLKVLNAKAISATEIEVMFNDRNTETYTLDEALELGEITEVEVEYKGEKFLVKVKWDGEDAGNVAPGTVAFANQPAAKSLPAGAPLNEVYKFQVTAGEDAITLRSVQLKQYGTARANDDDIKYVHLAVDGDIKATGTLNARNEVRLTRSLNIPANSTVEFTVLADLNTTAMPTATAQFGIESINAFTANATLNGSFPNLGNSFNFVAGNIGVLTVANKEATSEQSTDYTVETGELQEEIGKFRLQANSTEGVKVNRITLKADGINADDFENLYLYENNGKDRIDVQGVASRNEVVFDLSKANIEIDRNQAKSLVLKGDALEGDKKGYFKVDKTYDVVAQGLNSGYNNMLSLGNATGNVGDANFKLGSKAQSLGLIEVQYGKPTFRISTNTPKQGDKIVASTSEYGVVREYTFNSAGQDITLKNANLYIDTEGFSGDISQQIRTVELYDATSGAVIKSYDVKDGDQNKKIPLDNLNWLIDATEKKNINLQLRAVATNEDSSVGKLDLRLGNLEYEIQTATGSDKVESVGGSGLPGSPQYKEFTTSGRTEVDQPGSKTTLKGYSISGGLSEAPIGLFRVEAKDEKLKLTDVDVEISGLGNKLDNEGNEVVDGQGNPVPFNAEEVFANPVLKYDGKVIAYGDFTGNKVEFDIAKDLPEDFVVELGQDNRKVLEVFADVLEANVADNAQIKVDLTKLSTRGVNSNIVTENTLPKAQDGTVIPQPLIVTAADKKVADYLDYRKTSVSVNLSNEAYDTTAASDARVLKFTVTNMAPNNIEDKKVTVESVAFKNLFDFNSRFDGYVRETSGDTSAVDLFKLRENDSTLYNFKDQKVDYLNNKNKVILSEGDVVVKGDDQEEFFLHANFAATYSSQPGSTNNIADYGVFYNTTMQLDLDLDTANWGIWTNENTPKKIRPLFVKEEGPRITIK